MKLVASLSLDLDNKWSYMKTHSDAGWETFPTYLDVVVPRALNFLKERDLNITFFIVGQDAALEKNHAAIKQIADAGHEIGNHSFNHEPWLHLYSKAEIVDELAKTEDALKSITGQRPIGFRGPGYSLSPAVLETLVERGYEYDCSTLPTYIAPLARAYYFFASPKMSAEEKEKRKQLFGKLSDGFQPLKPYAWNIGGRQLVEIPVTTFPWFKVPIHFSYVLYLATFSELVARIYFKTAISFCRLTGTQPSLLMHPLDFLDGHDAPELEFFPAMNKSAEKKMEILGDMLEYLGRHYCLVNMQTHAAEAAGRKLRLMRSAESGNSLGAIKSETA